MYAGLNQVMLFTFVTHVLNEHGIMKFNFLLLRALFFNDLVLNPYEPIDLC